MKKTFVTIVVFLFVISTHAQDNILNLQWWRQQHLLNDYPLDQKRLYEYINDLNRDAIIPLKVAYDKSRKEGNIAERKKLRVEIEGAKAKIDNNIAKIKSSRFYYQDSTAKPNKKDTSFLFYYTNKELNDYLNTLDAFKHELSSLMPASDTDNSMSVFDRANFLNAYYNVSLSRSLLLAAMNNLERYYLLGSVSDSINDKARMLRDTLHKVDSVQFITTKQIRDTLDSVQTLIDTLLRNKFVPYRSLNKNRMEMIEKPSDKISHAANTILIDNRRNWWWRTLIGGVVGGLVAGVLVYSLK